MILKSSSIIFIGMTMLSQVQAATLKVEAAPLGPTPTVIGYNKSYHFPRGGNTLDWWRYSGVSGARVFIQPSTVEPKDDLPPHGDGVTNESSFVSRRNSLRADPLNSKYINWKDIQYRYEERGDTGYSLRELRKLGLKICVNITAGMAVEGENDWAGKWELWQHYYFQAFYLGREFDVERYQMFNEPNHGGGKLTIDEYMIKLKLASDAIQCALIDVNKRYKRTLKAMISAPVNSGNPIKNYPTWGQPIIRNLHTDFLGKTNPSFRLVHIYSYQSYGKSPGSFGSTVTQLDKLLKSEMPAGEAMPIAITEFNTHTGSNFSEMKETLDTPELYAGLGAICVNLMTNGMQEMYVFRFPRANDGLNGNGMHYIDGVVEPNLVGGVTRAGEVWRLFNKAFAPGRQRFKVSSDKNTEGLDVHACFDPVNSRYYLYCVNTTPKAQSLDLDLSAWKIPVGNRVLLEEVSETHYGAIRISQDLASNQIVAAGDLAPHSVWLLSVSALPQSKVGTLKVNDDVEARDGIHAGKNFASAKTMLVRNDPASVDNRCVAFLKFNLSGVDLKNLVSAELILDAASAPTEATAQAHVYGLGNDSWAQSGLTWNKAPQLRSKVPAGNTIAQRVVTEQGDKLFIVGQLVTSSAASMEKRVDVTGFVRSQSDGAVSFLISQDPRWNVKLPTMEKGDTQASGIQIQSREGGNGPALQLTFKHP